METEMTGNCIRIAVCAGTMLVSTAGICQAPPPLKAGSPYNVARASVLAGGWTAVVKDQRKLSELDRALMDWFLQRKYFEVWGCAPTGMGLCRAYFRDSTGRLLRVITTSIEGIDNNPGAAPEIVSWALCKGNQSSDEPCD
jgi:hypothetical protein